MASSRYPGKPLAKILDLPMIEHVRRRALLTSGVDEDQLRPASIKVNNPPRIVFAGRLMAQKNPLQIVHSLTEVKDLPWECVILGDGPLMSDVKKSIYKHGLQNRVSLPGWVKPEEVLGWFDKSDILFMPSLSEGLPVVGVQALAKGLAFVVSNIGGFIDLVDDEKNGFLVSSDRPTDFSIALRKLLINSSRLTKYREASRKKAAKFDIFRIAEQYEQTFSNIVNTNK